MANPTPATSPQPAIDFPLEESPTTPSAAAAEPVSQVRPVVAAPKNAPAPVKIPAIRPVPIRAEIQLFTETERRGRRIRFIFSESIVLAGLGFLIRFALSQHFADRTIMALLGILIVVVVAAAVALPIAFVRNNPERLYRR